MNSNCFSLKGHDPGLTHLSPLSLLSIPLNTSTVLSFFPLNHNFSFTKIKINKKKKKMEDHYGISDLRQFISGGRPLYPTLNPPPPDLHPPPHPYNNMVAVFRSDSTNTSVNTSAAGFSGFEMEAGGLNGGGGGGGGGRWPRQETLTLLEIRSRLDPSFKEVNQKGPLWDEVSRIMCEEHGYQRSGKKCREKFENLYKYYKKTKDGKAGRQDGKHYRFFRQLEALYGETNNSALASEPHVVNGNFNYNNISNNNLSLPNHYNNQESVPGSKLSDTSLSLSNFSEYETTSTDDSDQNDEENDLDKKKKRSKRNWKIKIKDFIDAQMRKLMDKQEVWMEKIMTTIEQKEQERISREEEWRKQDAARIEVEHKFWASERAWIEARDSALMDSFHKMSQNQNDENQQKWEMVNNYVLKCNNYNKKRNHDQSSICNQGGSSGGTFDEQGTIMRLNDHNGNSSEQGVDDHAIRLNNDQANSSHRNNGNAISESCFKYFMGDPYGRILD